MQEIAVKKNMFRALKTIIGYGKYRPTQFFGESQSLIGINMLQIGDHKPQVLQQSMKTVVDLYKNGKINPVIGKTFKASQLIEAHDFIQERKSMGKIAIIW